MNALTIAYLCMLVVALLPYVATVIAKSGRCSFDNHDPRGWLAQQEGYRKRANAAQLNAFEAQASFYAAVLLNVLIGSAPASVNVWALVFVAMRVLHLVFYLADKDRARSLSFGGALACVVGLFVLALMNVK
jgi:uncharacterized MAPEG superfamily protein